MHEPQTDRHYQELKRILKEQLIDRLKQAEAEGVDLNPLWKTPPAPADSVPSPKTS